MIHYRIMLGTALVMTLATCGPSDPSGLADELAQGTWGGKQAAVMVNGDLAHVHVGCTNGNFPVPVELDADGRFSVAGDYLLRAYPVAIGPTMPAQFAGVVHGRELVMTVAVNDTVAHELVVLGPVTVQLGHDPEMGPCPICVM
jgi:hypothetical protein